MKFPNRGSELPKTLKKLREKNRFSQKQIAEILNISQAKYNYFESGKYAPDVVSIKILADLYHLSVAELLEEPLLVPRTKTTSVSLEQETKLIATLNEKNNNDREKLICVYEKRISELEEKCLRKNNKIVSLMSKLEKLNKTNSDQAVNY